MQPDVAPAVVSVSLAGVILGVILARGLHVSLASSAPRAAPAGGSCAGIFMPDRA